ncbi:MAG: polymerase IV-like protein ImuB, partial [Acidobacteria bacterium]|nr:polymerase IV-like protein ImuB [Acidobacteriota bacterium]
VGFALTAYPDRPRRAQLSLFGPSALAPEKLATTIARLISILGEHRVGMPVSVDGHLPERFAIQAFEPPAPPDVRRSPKKSHGILALRIFRPPIPVEVTVRDSGDAEHGRLQIESIVSLAGPAAPMTAPAGGGRPRVEMGSKGSDIGGPVRVSSGPWQVEEGWWTETPAAREYWDVELEKGGIYRLFRGAGSWFIDARYD